MIRPRSARKVRSLGGAVVALLCLLPGVAFGQAAVLQGGSFAAGRVPIYGNTGSGSQPVVIDSGPAGSTVIGQGISELNITARCQTPPCAATGTGPDGTIFSINDAVTANATGGHTLAFSANALGGGLIEYGPFGTATALPFNFRVNGTTYAFPFVTGGIVGPGTTTVGHLAVWNNTTGTLLADGGVALAIGGTNGQIQFNSSGSLGGFTLGGDATVNTGTGALTINEIQNHPVTIGGPITTGGTLTLADSFFTSGANPLTLTTTGSTNVTLPTTGTLATRAGSEALTNKTYNGLTINSTTGTFALTNGKTWTVSNTLQITGTDGSTLNVGTGGTLGTAAYTAATAYTPSTAAFQTAAFVSSDTAFTNGSTTTLAHGLGSARLSVQVMFVCQSNDQGYTTGQIIVQGPAGSASNIGSSVAIDATNVDVLVGSGGVYVINTGTYAAAAIDPTKWKIRVAAFKYQ